MARIINDEQGSQSHQADEGHLTVLQADGQSSIKLPEGDFLSHGDILRDGQDLILQSSDGRELVIEDYFSAGTSPVLTTPQGSQLTPELVQSFVKSQIVELAANETGSDASGVGIIKEVSGDATITRADGTSEKVTLGTAVHQGDIIETAAEGAVNIVFLDESTFAISNNARMAIDEYVFDPSTQAGETNVSILRGMFVFTSGLIGRDDPDDVQIETPVGSIGIRGTTIAGHINPNGESQITVVEGAIVIRNGNTSVTLADQYETVKLTGFDAPIQMAGTLDANAMKASYGVLGTVAPAFMNTLNTEPADNRDAAEENDADAPADGEVPAEDTPPADEQGQVEAEQPVVASYDIFSDPLNTGFDLSVTAQPVDPFDTNTVVAASLLGTSALQLAPLGSSPTGTVAIDTSTGLAVMATAETPTLLPLEIVVEIEVDESAIAGDVVGRIFTTIAFPDVNIRFANVPTENGDPVFELVMVSPGVYNVVLTDAGEDAVLALAGTSGTSLGDVDVVATLPDGRSTTSITPTNYGDYSGTGGGVVVTGPLQIHSMSTSVSTDGYYYNAASAGAGAGAAYLGMNEGFLTTIGNQNAIAGNGDINGDGYLDYIVGSVANGDGANQVFVYSGTGSPPAWHTDSAYTGDSFLGTSVALVDFDGDGYADAFASAPGSNGGNGRVDAMWGGTGNTLSGTAPFSAFLTGGALSTMGNDMASLRDFNSDGFGDLAVSYNNGGSWSVRVYYGNENGTPAGYGMTTITNVDSGKVPIYDLGDINGDGGSDMMVGETGGAGRLLIYLSQAGTPTGLTAQHTIAPAAGSEIVGGGSAGDFNGDGYDDVFVAVQTGTIVNAYVLYGGTLGASTVLDSAWLTANADNYFHMQLDLSQIGNPASIDLTGYAIGDQNNDGFEDLLIASPDIDPASVGGINGGYFVVHGRPETADMAGADPQIHAAGYNHTAGTDMHSSSNGDGLVGYSGFDNMSNWNGTTAMTNISFRAGGGDDIIRLHGTGNNLACVINGGTGMDDLGLYTSGNVDLSYVSEFIGVEAISFQSGTGAQLLRMGLNDIFSLLQSSDDGTLTFTDGNATFTDGLIIESYGTADTGGGNVLDGSNTALAASLGLTYAGVDGNGNNVFNFGSGYQLLIDADIGVTIQ